MHLQRLVVLALISTAACRTGTKPSEEAKLASTLSAEDAPDLCYGYRGNGTSVFATLGGAARLMDEFGAPSAVIGTSSGSVAAFLTDSVMAPDAVYDCTDCSPSAASERRSFMLKAFPMFIEAYSESEGLAQDIARVKAAKQVYDLIVGQFFKPSVNEKAGDSAAAGGSGQSAPRIIDNVYVQGVLSFASLSAIQTGTREVKNLISPDFYRLVGFGGTPQPQMIHKVIDNFLLFRGQTDASGFSRQSLMYPGIFNFDRLFEVIGIVGDWYAAYGDQYPRDAMRRLLDVCAKGSRAQWWNAIADRPYGASTCGREYYRMFSAYFNARLENPSGRRRIQEPIGTYIPSFVSTSSIAGNAVVDRMNQAADAGRYDEIDELELGRENFATLYFGPEKFNEAIRANKSMFDDTLTKSIVSMGPLTWLQSMKASGQEPATARSVTYRQGKDRYLAMGGFVDQLQSKLARMIGCQTTVAINTTKPITNFSERYAPKTWDKFPSLTQELFDPSSPSSAESLAFPLTDALLCSRWSNYTVTEIWEMADNSFHEFIFTSNSRLASVGQELSGLNPQLQRRSEPPKSCYGLEEKRNHKFPAYKP
jgi:hypothetical protein